MAEADTPKPKRQRRVKQPPDLDTVSGTAEVQTDDEKNYVSQQRIDELRLEERGLQAVRLFI